MSGTHVLILHNEPILPSGHPDYESEREVVATVAAVSENLIDAGFDVTHLGISADPDALIGGLREHRPDVVFNLFEGTGDRGSTETHVAGLLEWLGVPFTGSPSQALFLSHCKHLTKHLFRANGIATPEFIVADAAPVTACPLQWPVIVKPAREHASVGLDQQSVVDGLDRLNARVAMLLDRYGAPILVEEFIRGREFYVALVEAPELRCLPFSEIDFQHHGPLRWPIVTYDAKWKPGSYEDLATPTRCPAEVEPDLAALMEAMARGACNLLGCRDYVRCDFRVSESGRPYLLEVNPNPDLHPDAGLTEALEAAGITYGQFMTQLVRNALRRGETVAASCHEG